VPEGARRVLLAEDDRFLRRAAEARLRQHGLEVLTAVDGEEALRVARAEHPDLVLLDVLSNLGQERDVEQATALGAVAFLVKANLSLQDLVQRVDAVLATGTT